LWPVTACWRWHYQAMPRIGLQALTLGAMAFVLATCLIWAFANVVVVTNRWEFDDVHAYLGAAERLLAGKPLYVLTPDLSDTYFYAPWFAFVWVPFVTLPRLAVEVAWAAVLVAATIAALLPFRRSCAGVALALLLGALLYRTAGWGNVQPLLVAALIYLLPTRAGPWIVGVGASLKPWPILAVAIYAWRRQWSAVAISLGVAALLWLPILLFDWTAYPSGVRAPNIYDATFLLAVPALIGAARGIKAR
jgi:hypothetical protein